MNAVLPFFWIFRAVRCGSVSTMAPLLLLSLILSCSLLYILKQCSTYLPVAQISLEKNVNRITGGAWLLLSWWPTQAMATLLQVVQRR